MIYYNNDTGLNISIIDLTKKINNCFIYQVITCYQSDKDFEDKTEF